MNIKVAEDIKRLRDIQLTFPPYCRALAFFLFQKIELKIRWPDDDDDVDESDDYHADANHDEIDEDLLQRMVVAKKVTR